jgi:hypothetical protein
MRLGRGSDVPLNATTVVELAHRRRKTKRRPLPERGVGETHWKRLQQVLRLLVDVRFTVHTEILQ